MFGGVGVSMALSGVILGSPVLCFVFVWLLKCIAINLSWVSTTDEIIFCLNSAPWSIRYVIRYFLYNMLRSRPTIHTEGFNMHDVKGAVSFVTVAAISIDRPIKVEQYVSC